MSLIHPWSHHARCLQHTENPPCYDVKMASLTRNWLVWESAKQLPILWSWPQEQCCCSKWLAGASLRRKTWANWTGLRAWVLTLWGTQEHEFWCPVSQLKKSKWENWEIALCTANEHWINILPYTVKPLQSDTLSGHLLYQIANVTGLQKMIIFFQKKRKRETQNKFSQNAQVSVYMHLVYHLLAVFTLYQIQRIWINWSFKDLRLVLKFFFFAYISFSDFFSS